MSTDREQQARDYANSVVVKTGNAQFEKLVDGPLRELAAVAYSAGARSRDAEIADLIRQRLLVVADRSILMSLVRKLTPHWAVLDTLHNITGGRIGHVIGDGGSKEHHMYVEVTDDEANLFREATK